MVPCHVEGSEPVSFCAFSLLINSRKSRFSCGLSGDADGRKFFLDRWFSKTYASKNGKKAVY
jgi:hypothetical protein